MPIYEYACQHCGREIQTLIMSPADEAALTCPTCGGRGLHRLISRVIYHQSERDRLSSYDPGARRTDSFYKDTRNIGLHAKKRAEQMGVDLGSGFEAKLEKLRTDPGSVLRDSD